jgi:hypothetical protein
VTWQLCLASVGRLAKGAAWRAGVDGWSFAVGESVHTVRATISRAEHELDSRVSRRVEPWCPAAPAIRRMREFHSWATQEIFACDDRAGEQQGAPFDTETHQ